MIAALAIALAFAACQGADPAITNVTKTKTANEGLTTYSLSVTVTNLGSRGQRSIVLQSVEIRLNGAKNGEKGIAPADDGLSTARSICGTAKLPCVGARSAKVPTLPPLNR